MPNMTLDDILRRGVERYADLVALSSPDRDVTYAGLDEQATRFANGLLAMGLGSGDRVAVLLQNRAEYIVAVFGVSRAGLVLVPINRRIAAAEAVAVAEDAAPRVLVSEPFFDEVVEALAAVPSLTHTIMVAADGQQRVLTFEDFVRDASTRAPEIAVRPDDLQAIYYTSGTTGMSKGVMRSQSANAWSAVVSAEVLPTGPGEAWLYTIPMHSIALYGLGLAPLWTGGRMLFTERFDPAESIALVQRTEAAVVHMVPTMWEMAVRFATQQGEQLPSVRHALWGGMPMSRGIAQRLEAWLPVPCVGCYGSTEAPCMTYSTPEISASGRFDSSGPAVGGMELRVVDDDGRPVPAGEYGEVLVRGPLLMDGYLNQPEVTAAVLDEDGWYHTGDRGKVDEDGALTVNDRKKDMIISGGENVYPGEIENVVSTLPGVLETAVVGIPDEIWGQSVCAFVVRETDALTESTIKERCRERLAGYKTPRRVVFVDTLPKNAMGKIVKHELLASLER